jgi:succinyl-diaminopimelate desuccinylase
MEMSHELDLLSRLVEIDTNANTKTGYTDCSELIRKEAEDIGLKTRVYDSRDISEDKKPRPCIVADLDVEGEQRLLLAAHYDIVAPGKGWKQSPFQMRVVGGRAFGRGTSDDKGAIVAALSAAKELLRTESKVNVSLLVTPDEEVGGRLGLGYLMSEVGIKGDAAVVLDSGPDAVSIGASGIVWGKVLVTGKQGHAGEPHRALNAINLSIPLLEGLSEYSKTREKSLSRIPAPPNSPHKFIHGRFSITILRAGEKENIIPGECEARFDLRTNPDENAGEVKRGLERYFRKLTRRLHLKASLEYEYEYEFPNYFTNPNQPIVKKLVNAVKSTSGRAPRIAGEFGGNDGHYFAKQRIPVVCYGPSRADNRYHGIDEFVYIKDLDLTRRTIVNLCQQW